MTQKTIFSSTPREPAGEPTLANMRAEHLPRALSTSYNVPHITRQSLINCTACVVVAALRLLQALLRPLMLANAATAAVGASAGAAAAASEAPILPRRMLPPTALPRTPPNSAPTDDGPPENAAPNDPDAIEEIPHTPVPDPSTSW
jgi:hypothetical protein